MEDEKRTRLLEDLDNVRKRIGELEDSEKERAESEKQLREDSERYRHVVDTAPLGVFSVDVQGKIKYINTLMLKHFALPSAEKARELDALKSSPFVEAGVSENIRKCMETQKQNVLENSFSDKNGNQTWFRYFLNPIIDKDGSINGVLTVVDDITKQKSSQNKMTAELTHEKNMHNIFSKLVGVFDIDEAISATLEQMGDQTSASRAFLFLLYGNGTKMDNTHEWCASGIEPQIDNLQNLTVNDFPWWMKQLGNGAPVNVTKTTDMPNEAKAEKEWLDKQGVKSYLMLPVQVKNKLEGFIGLNSTKEQKKWDNDDVQLLQTVAGVVGDFLEKKRADDKEKERDERLRRLAHASVEGIFIVRDGKILDINNAASAMLGYKPSEYQDKDLVYFLDNPEKDKVMQYMAENSSKPLETVAKKKDGTMIPVEMQAKNLLYQDESLTVVAVRDISERAGQTEAEKESITTLKEAMEGSVQALALTIAMRDPFAAGHGEGVSQLACAIAQEMGLPEEKIEGLRITGIIHDIGKISIPTEILSKPGKISEAERMLVENHPQQGYNILKDVKFPWPVAQIVLQHHERMNGTGYPAGLSGDEILPEARIMGVADTVDAIMSHRSYRPAKGLESAVEELTKHKGSLYDPDVVDAALKVINDRGFPFKN